MFYNVHVKRVIRRPHIIPVFEGPVRAPHSMLSRLDRHMSHISKLVRATVDFPTKSRKFSSYAVKEILCILSFETNLKSAAETPVIKRFVLEGYCDSDGLPHHSSDVFLHGESISYRNTSRGGL